MALRPFAPSQDIAGKTRLRINEPGNCSCCLLLQGTLSVRRLSDDLTISSTVAPSVIGISELLFPTEMHYLYFETIAEIILIPEATMKKQLEKGHLWLDLARMQAYIIQSLSLRDAAITGLTAYSIIRHQLQMLINEPEALRETITVTKYILQRTQLSRSSITKILGQLMKGEYIVMDKSKLISINTLPDCY
jgi:CRP-like cAMP-binding protein